MIVHNRGAGDASRKESQEECGRSRFPAGGEVVFRVSWKGRCSGWPDTPSPCDGSNPVSPFSLRMFEKVRGSTVGACVTET